MALDKDFAHYRIVGRLGAGGMGEVYRAEDTRLGRPVALKVLPADLAGDAERVARFRREAQILATLQHARIAAIHGVEETGGQMVLVLEFVEGEDLGQRLARGALPVDEALAIGRQIAEALEAAHDKGIVHRDLKPANVMLMPDGGIKVLDFGLAKALLNDSGDALAGLSASPTLTHQGTQAGVVLGTAAYMSPEQARGRPVDRRADVWAFGCALYEMITGKRAFPGDTTADIVAAIVKEEPDWEALPGDLPPALPLLVRRCLVKDPLRRLQAIGEARLALETSDDPGLTAALSMVGVGLPDPRRKAPSLTERTGIAPWLVLSLLIIMGFVTLIVGISSRTPADIPLVVESSATRQLEIVVARDESLANSPGAAVVMSRDGKRIAWVAGPGDATRLYLRDLSGGPPRALADTDGAYAPFFSPDGDWLGYFSSGSLKKVNVVGGIPIELAPAIGGRGATWLENDQIAYTPSFESGLFVVNAGGGGEHEALTELGETERSHRWPHGLAGTDWILFMSQAQGAGYDDATIEAVSVLGRKRHVVHQGGTYPRSSDDSLLFVRGATLFAAPLDMDDAELLGEPQPILAGVVASPPDQEQGDGSAQLDAASGRLLYRAGGVLGSEVSLSLLDRDGGYDRLISELSGGRSPAVSPDGRRIAFVQVADTANALWVYDIHSGALDRLTFGGMNINSPVWSPEGEYITYGAIESGEPAGMFRQRVDGTEGRERLRESAGRGQWPSAWTPDGRTLVYREVGGRVGSGLELWQLRFESPSRIGPGSGTAERLARSEHVGFVTVSPDGQFVAFDVVEGEGTIVVAQRLGDPSSRWQLSAGAGEAPRWSRDGTEVFFVAGRQLMSVPVTVEGEALRPGRPVELASADFIPRGFGWAAGVSSYDPMPDGQGFVFMRPEPRHDLDTEHAILVLDFDPSEPLVSIK